MGDNISQNTGDNYYCIICDYKCSRKSDYNKHLSTSKHTKGYKTVTNDDNISHNVASNVCNCGKIYKHRQGLSRHKKKCSITQGKEISNTNNSPTTDIEKELLIKMLLKNQDVMDKMIEMMPNMGMNNNTNSNITNNTNSHNTTNNQSIQYTDVFE
jgi:hypothetical protein